MHYSKVKREKIGSCNLCRKEEVLLTWDHVPPKGGIEVSSVEIRTILQTLSGDSSKDQFQISQNGVKFRTICKQCNDWLGKEYDPALNKFASDISLFVKSSLHLPPVLTVPTKPYRLMRAILAHLVAAKIDMDEGEFDGIVKGFIFNKDVSIPEDINIFYWTYAYPQQVILRDVVMPAKRGDFSETMFCQLIKYFPVAYLVTTASRYEGLPELTRYRNSGPEDIVDIIINLRNLPNQYWPEAPDPGNILFGGQAMVNSVISSPRKKR